MNNNYYNLAKKNGWSSKFLDQLKTTNNDITNSYGQQKKTINTKYDNSIAQYNPQKDQVKQVANQSGRDAYVNYMKSINPFSSNQNQLARAGLTNSGYAESLGLKANSDYQTNVGNALTTRDLALANIDNQINSLENERNAELSELSRNENDDLLQNYYKIMQLREDQKKREDIEKKNKTTNSSNGNGSNSYTYTTTPSYTSKPTTTNKKTSAKQNAKNYKAGGGGYAFGGGGKGARGVTEVGSRKNNKPSIFKKIGKGISNLFQFL